MARRRWIIFSARALAPTARSFPRRIWCCWICACPAWTGWKCCGRSRSHPTLRRTPVVVLTTSDAERDVAVAYEYHANSFVTKPVDFQRLSRVIERTGILAGRWKIKSTAGGEGD